MTDEAKALVDAKLYGMGILKNGKHVTLEDVYLDPRDAIIETQSREIERLRAVLDNIAHESSDTWARRDACVALGIDWPEARRQP